MEGAEDTQPALNPLATAFRPHKQTSNAAQLPTNCLSTMRPDLTPTDFSSTPPHKAAVGLGGNVAPGRMRMSSPGVGDISDPYKYGVTGTSAYNILNDLSDPTSYVPKTAFYAASQDHSIEPTESKNLNTMSGSSGASTGAMHEIGNSGINRALSNGGSTLIAPNQVPYFPAQVPNTATATSSYPLLQLLQSLPPHLQGVKVTEDATELLRHRATSITNTSTHSSSHSVSSACPAPYTPTRPRATSATDSMSSRHSGHRRQKSVHPRRFVARYDQGPQPSAADVFPEDSPQARTTSHTSPPAVWPVSMPHTTLENNSIWTEMMPVIAEVETDAQGTNQLEHGFVMDSVMESTANIPSWVSPPQRRSEPSMLRLESLLKQGWVGPKLPASHPSYLEASPPDPLGSRDMAVEHPNVSSFKFPGYSTSIHDVEVASSPSSDGNQKIGRLPGLGVDLGDDTPTYPRYRFASLPKGKAKSTDTRDIEPSNGSPSRRTGLNTALPSVSNASLGGGNPSSLGYQSSSLSTGKKPSNPHAATQSSVAIERAQAQGSKGIRRLPDWLMLPASELGLLGGSLLYVATARPPVPEYPQDLFNTIIDRQKHDRSEDVLNDMLMRLFPNPPLTIFPTLTPGGNAANPLEYWNCDTTCPLTHEQANGKKYGMNDWGVGCDLPRQNYEWKPPHVEPGPGFVVRPNGLDIRGIWMA